MIMLYYIMRRDVNNRLREMGEKDADTLYVLWHYHPHAI